MLKKIIKIVIILLGFIIAIILAVFIISFYLNPYKSLYVYLGNDGSSVWVEGNPLSFRKEISGTRSPKSSDIKWSPNNNYVAFYDNVRETPDMNREWFLKIFNPRTFSVRTIFIGPWITSSYEWIDNNTIRIFIGGASGARFYRNLDIHRKNPYVYVDDRGADDNSKWGIEVYKSDGSTIQVDGDGTTIQVYDK
jgi:hypothetical protein